MGSSAGISLSLSLVAGLNLLFAGLPLAMLFLFPDLGSDSCLSIFPFFLVLTGFRDTLLSSKLKKSTFDFHFH
jgi:hypothetical protein